MLTAQEISRAKTNPVSQVMRGYGKLRAFRTTEVSGGVNRTLTRVENEFKGEGGVACRW